MRTILVFILMTLVSSCEQNWGKKFKDFSTNEAASLSRRYAEADLKNKWSLILRESIAQYTLQLRGLSKRLSLIEVKSSSVNGMTDDDIANEIVTLKHKHQLVK
jgi:hypothetical protein